MIRKVFVMSVHSGQEKEYEKRHSPVWKELLETLKNHGVHRYSISLLPGTRQLFGYAEVEEEEQWKAIGRTAICRKWWAYMKDIMPTNPDNSPVQEGLREVFYMD